MAIKYVSKRKRGNSRRRPNAGGRALPGLRSPSPFKVSNARENILKARAIRTPLRLKGLKPLTLYKILSVSENSGNTNFGAQLGKKYIDVTPWFLPGGNTRRQNTKSRLTTAGVKFAPVRTGTYLRQRAIFSDAQGRIDGVVLTSALNDPHRATNRSTVATGFWRQDGKNYSYPLKDTVFTVVPADATIDPSTWEGKPITCQIPNPPVIIPSPKASNVYAQQRFEVDFVQSFYIDPNSVGKAKTVDITSVNLYVRKQPSRTRNRSRIANPGINIGIVDIENGKPVITRQYKKSLVDADYNECSPSGDSSVPTLFKFADPITVETGKFYGIAIDLEDVEYELWMARNGHRTLGTNVASTGAAREHRGELFTRSNAAKVVKQGQKDNYFVARRDIDLKFDINVARYSVTDVELDFVNDSYEFMTVSSVSGEFDEDELVYQDGGQIAGTTYRINSGSRRVVGTGTLFTQDLSDGDVIIMKSTTDSSLIDEVGIVDTVISDTVFLLAECPLQEFQNTETNVILVTPTGKVDTFVPQNNKLYLTDSTANTTAGHLFQVGQTIVGLESNVTATLASLDNVSLDSFSSNFDLKVPSTFSVDPRINVTYDFGGQWYTSTDANYEQEVDLTGPNQIRTVDSYILSKSVEVANPTNLYNNEDGGTAYDEPKSLHLKMFLDYEGADGDKTYEAPTIETTDMSAIVTTWTINNSEVGEHTDYGNALTKHISKKLTFTPGQEAEDIRVIYNAYQPPGTKVSCYAKIINENDSGEWSEKQWTKLELTSGANTFSDTDDLEDNIELEFGFPDYPASLTTVTGTVDATAATDVITGSGTIFQTTVTVNGDQSASLTLTLNDASDVEKGARISGTGILANTTVTQIQGNVVTLDKQHQGVLNAATLNVDNIFDGEIIKIYNSLFPENYGIFSVESVDSATQITLSEAVSNVGIQEEGLKIDKLVAPYSAFNNKDNLNIVRYFDEAGSSYDKYITVAIKTVLLSSNTQITPSVEDYRVIGVSA